MTTLYAWVNGTDDGQESIVALTIPNMGANIPMVFVRENVARLLRPIVAEHVAQHGHSARLIKFRADEIVDTVRFER